MTEKQPETSFDILIDGIYQDNCREKLDTAMEYLHEWCRKSPETFDNKYRNIHNFVSTKAKEDQKAYEESLVEKVDYNKL